MHGMLKVNTLFHQISSQFNAIPALAIAGAAWLTSREKLAVVEVFVWKCSIKQVFLNILQNS